MSASIHRVEYFTTTVHGAPDAAYALLGRLAAAGVDLLAFNAIPVGLQATQLVLFPRRGELLTHLGFLRGGVSAARIEAMADRFELDLSARIGTLSRGNRQKVGVVQAFMHEPELLILDEPTSGLDPLLQQEFLQMAREARGAGQTVFMSSHVLSEVQQSADRVGIVRDGVMVAVESVDDLRRRAVRRVEIRFDDPVPEEVFAELPGVTDVRLDGSVLSCRLAGRADPLVKAAARWGVESMVIEEPDLEELFFTYYAEPLDAA